MIVECKCFPEARYHYEHVFLYENPHKQTNQTRSLPRQQLSNKKAVPSILLFQYLLKRINLKMTNSKNYLDFLQYLVKIEILFSNLIEIHSIMMSCHYCLIEFMNLYFWFQSQGFKLLGSL